MRSERGQGTVEWIAIVLLVAIAMAALGRLAARDGDRGLATTLVHSVTCASRDSCDQPRGHEAFTLPPLVPHPDPMKDPPRPRGRGARPGWAGRPLPRWTDPGGRALLRWVRRAGGRALVDRLRRGAGLAWRRAWFGCLTYERARWAFLHPESTFPGYTMPPSEVLRIANDCISPVDLVRDWPLLRGK